MRYEDQQKTVKTNDTQQQGSSLSGGSLEVAAGGDLSIKGGNLKATNGDASLSGKQVELLADHDRKTESTDTRTTGGGFYYTGGLDRAGNGVEFAHSSTQDTRDTSTANTTGIAASGNLSIKAGNTLVTEGAQVKADGKLQVNAEQVDNRAAHNTESTSHKENT